MPGTCKFDEALERALREAEPPDAVRARARARETVLAAHRARPPRRGPRAALVWALVACVVAAVGFSLRNTEPAREVRERVRDVLVRPTPTPTPAATLPGRLLVEDRGELFVVRGERRTALGAWDDATWSPRGLFVGVTRGRTLAAIDPKRGAVRWRIVRDAPVSFPRWAPGGLHIAYRAGSTLRIVYGNGRHDVLAGRDMAAVAPAWRPSQPRTVAWAAKDGTITVEDADTAKVLWTFRDGAVRRLAWSADGRVLVAAGRRRVVVHDLVTGTQRSARQPGEVSAIAFSRRLAVATYRGGTTEVRIAGGAGLTAPGRVRDLEWAPDGRSLLAGWGGADHWLVVRRSSGEVGAVRHRFGPAARTHGWVATP